MILVWASLVVMVVAAPELAAQVLRLPGGGWPAEDVFMVVLSGFLVVLDNGILRRWRWMFWLILAAFPAGLLRVPVGLLQIAGVFTPEGPTWYVAFQMVIGMIQFAIGLEMLGGYGRGGAWAG